MTRRGAVLGLGLLVVLVQGAFAFFWWSHDDVSSTPSFAYFREHVAPILARNCSSRDESGAFVCHGRPGREAVKSDGDYESGVQHAFPTRMANSCTTKCHGRQAGRQRFLFGVSPEGEINTQRRVVLAYQKARELARYDGAARFAKLLRMPLGSQAGGLGLYHGGGEIFEDAADPDFRRLARWVVLENETAREKTSGPSAAEIAFRDKVLPVFARNSCFASACHIFNHSSFIPDPGMPSDDLAAPIADRFTAEQVSFNRMTSKGLIHRIVYLTGDIEQSRMLRKIIPMEAGGVLHRGGNNQFLTGPDDPDYAAIKDWLTLERHEAIAKLRIEGRPVADDDVGKVRGVVFVRTRTDNRRHYLDIGRYLPGGDLYLLKLAEGETLATARGEPINLTARFHAGREADVREPDVRYDGRAVLFAMRVGEDDGLNIYEIRLDENLDYVEESFRRLTHGPDYAEGSNRRPAHGPGKENEKEERIRVHFTDPTYVPDPLDEGAAGGGFNLERADIVFVSNLAGEVVQSFERGIVGEADGGTRTTIVDLDRPEVEGSFVGRRLYIVDGTNKGAWRTIKSYENRLFTAAGRSTLTVDRPFPEPIDNSSIYVIEREGKNQPGFLPSYSVYGMKDPAPGEEQRIYDATITRITWTPAQDLDLSVRSTGEVFYASQRSACDKYGRPIFHVASCRRHLDTRFSFPTHQGNRSQVLVYADNHELPTGIDIHVGLDPDNLWEGGNLSVSDHQFGPGLEARNPNDFATGLFDEDGTPRTTGTDITNTRFIREKRGAAHPRHVFKKTPLFPLRGPNAVSRTGYSPGGIYRDAIPLPDGRLIVSHSPAPIDHLDPNANPDFDLYVLAGQPGFGPPGGKGVPKIRKLRIAAASARGMSDLQAYPICVRFKPKINAGRRPRGEHLIRYPGMAPDRRPARYLERNYLLIDAIMRDPSPYGKHVAYDIDPVTGRATDPIDRVRYVRMVEAVPMRPETALALDLSKVRNGDPQSTLVSNGIHPAKRLVGEQPLLDDGSIAFRMPSNTPLFVQSLNADRMALRQEARLYFFVPNEPFTISPAPSETFQTCAACMGSMSGKPERLFGPANLFAGQGFVEAVARYGKKPPAMALDVRDRLVIDFVADIQPMLDNHCVACHEGEKAAAGLSLTGRATTYYTDAYESLMQLEDPASGWYGRKKYVSERDGLAIESYLTEKLYGRELKAPRRIEGDVPHPSPALFAKHGLEARPLTHEQRLLFVRWMDFGATFRGAPPVPASRGGPDPKGG